MLSRVMTRWSALPHVRRFHCSKSIHKGPRVYRYAIDVHGQLFLHDTKPKNLTSCYKNPEFLNFFFSRIRPNEEEPDDSQTASLSEEWTEEMDFTPAEAMAIGRAQGYHWLSPCQGEYNLVRAGDSPIVFRELNDKDDLVWGGSMTCSFQPDKLKVDQDTGYLFHPSPEPPLASLRRKAEQGALYHPYGAYSLLSSNLVLQRLASGLELDPDCFADGVGGSIEYKGRRYDLGLLSEEDAARNRRYRVDDLATE